MTTVSFVSRTYDVHVKRNGKIVDEIRPNDEQSTAGDGRRTTAARARLGGRLRVWLGLWRGELQAELRQLRDLDWRGRAEHQVGA